MGKGGALSELLLVKAQDGAASLMLRASISAMCLAEDLACINLTAQAVHRRLAKSGGGGVVSIVGSPCGLSSEWVKRCPYGGGLTQCARVLGFKAGKVGRYRRPWSQWARRWGTWLRK